MSTQACPTCGRGGETPRNPYPTVDVIIFVPGTGVLLIERRFEPHGWALPGGFVDYGETVETAAVREAKEETGLDVTLIRLHGVYSDPTRDPRKHTMSVVFVGTPRPGQEPQAGDDAGHCAFHPLDDLPRLAFDHELILHDFARDLDRLAPGPRA